MSFVFNGRGYPYLRHEYNAAWTNERAVEVPIVYYGYVNGAPHPDGVLEVGDVLSHYFPFKHDVVDKFEGDTTIRKDIVDFVPDHPYDTIVSISTFEHIGFDSYHGKEARDPDKVIRALACVRSFLSPGGTAVITFPLGYNPQLDGHWKSGILGFDEEYYMRLYKRAVGTWDGGASVEWAQVEKEAVNIYYPYDFPQHIVIGVIKK